jgi:hypothetical protein
MLVNLDFLLSLKWLSLKWLYVLKHRGLLVIHAGLTVAAAKLHPVLNNLSAEPNKDDCKNFLTIKEYDKKIRKKLANKKFFIKN